MKYLLFNLAVTGALLYLLADAGVIEIADVVPAEHREMAEARAGKTVVVARRTRDQFLEALGQALDEARDGELAGSKILEVIEDRAVRRDPEPASAPSEAGSRDAPDEAADEAAVEAAVKAGDEATDAATDEAPAVGRGSRGSELTRAADLPPAPPAPRWEGAPSADRDDEPSADRDDEPSPPPAVRPPKPAVPQVKVVATSDPDVIRRRAEVLGDAFTIAGADTASVPAKPRRRSRARVVPSKEIAGMTPAERSRELDKLALDMELIFAEMSGR